MTAKRWEDVAVVWEGPDYFDQRITYASSVETGYVDGRVITCPEVVDWDNDGGRDLILSSWDPNYDGRVFIRREIGINDDGTPILGANEVVEGVRGYVTAVQDGDLFHLISASRMRPVLFFYPNIGAPGAPVFGDPVHVHLKADWVKGNEVFHLARFADIDGDGELELILGTDTWDDYWPNGIEWNEPGYRGYDAAGRWMGGPLRGYLYVFKNKGTLAEPDFDHGHPILAGDVPLEVYGQLAPAIGDLTDTGRSDIIAGEFWPILQFIQRQTDGSFAAPKLLQQSAGGDLDLEHCIHLPCITDWNGNGQNDILVGAEDGFVSFLKNTGETRNGVPVFEPPIRVETTKPEIHASVLPVPAAYDWTGNGFPDLLVGNATGELLFYPNMGPNEHPVVGREAHVTAGGEKIRIVAGLTGSIQGPSEKRFGYTCPTVADWDGDGNPDVLMSSVLGTHLFYKFNRMENGVPHFEAAQRLTYNDAPLKTVWRVRPTVVDWLNDGKLHYITLDEDGVLADYLRISDVVLDDKQLLCWQNGNPVTFTEDIGGGLGRIKLCACDWTGDGRVDLIVGTHARASVPPGSAGQPRRTTGQAAVLFLENVGTNAEPRFAPPRSFRFKGEPLAMGMHATGPEAVDWNGNGALDLIVGIEDGSMVWLPRADLSWSDPS